MAIDKEKLYREIQLITGTDDSAFSSSSLAIGSRQYLETQTEYILSMLCSGYSFNFTQVEAKTSNLTPNDDYDLTIRLSTDGYSIILPDSVSSVGYGESSGAQISFQLLEDIKREKYTDTSEIVYAWFAIGRKVQSPGNLLRFQTNQTGKEINITVYETPKDVSIFPEDFYYYFRNKLLGEVLKVKQSGNLGGIYAVFEAQAKDLEESLKAKYAKKVSPSFYRPLPYEGYNRNTMNVRRAR